MVSRPALFRLGVLLPAAAAAFAAALVLLPAGAQTNPNPQLRLSFMDFEDSNQNGLIDCYENVRFRASVFDTQEPAGTRVTGRVSVPSNTPANWSFQWGSVDIDRTVSTHCAETRIVGNGNNQSVAAVDFTCTAPDSGDGYTFAFYVSGAYTGITGGPIQIPASAEIFTPANTTLSDTASRSGTRGCAAIDLSLSKSDGGATASPGATIPYTLSYTNTGNVASSGTTITETVPANTTFHPGASTSGWTCSPSNAAGSTCTLPLGSVGAGAAGTRTFAVTVDLPLAESVTQIANSASIAGSPADSNPANNNASDTTPVNPGTPDLSLRKSLTSGSGDPGSTLVYSLALSNSGTRSAAAATLTETVPAYTTFNAAASSPGWTCSPSNAAGSTCTLAVGAVAAGSTLSRSFAVTVANPLPSNATGVTNTACSSTSTPGDPAANNCSTISTPTGGSPSLSISKNDGNQSAGPGDTIVYVLSYANSGPGNAPSTVLRETVPAHTTFNPAASSPGWSCSPSNAAGSTCLLDVGALGAGAAATRIFAVTVVVPVPEGVDQTANTVTISCAVPDLNPADNTSTDGTPLDPGNPDLQLTKTLSSGTADPGGVLVYTLTVTNDGDRPASAVDLLETVPQHTTFDAAASSPGWTCSPSGNAGSSCALQIPSLAQGGGSASRTFAVRVLNPLPAGVTTISNSACTDTATPGEPDPINCSTVNTPTTGSPSLKLSKSLASGSATPGTTLAFTLTATNSGNQGLANVVLTETVPEHSTFLAAASSPGWACPSTAAGAACTLQLGALAGGGASAARTFAVRVDNPLPPDAAAVANSACAAAGSVKSCDTVEIPTSAEPQLSIAKTLRSGAGTPGSTLAYSITVQNTGGRTAAAVVLTERVPAHTTFTAAASSPGWTCPSPAAGSTCTLQVGSLAGAGATTERTFAVQVVNPLPADARTIANEACTGFGGGAPTLCDRTTTPVTASPVLTISKIAMSGSVSPGGALVYTVGVRNTGNQEAADVTLRDTLPDGTRFLPAQSSPGWTCTGTPIVCALSVGRLAAGGAVERTLALELVPPVAAGVEALVNTACADDGSGPATCSTASTPITAAPHIALRKDPPAEPLAPNRLLVFKLTVTNTGDQSATGIVLTDAVPDRTTFDAAASSPSWRCPGVTPGFECVASVPDLPPGASAELVFAVRTASNLGGLRQLNNTACAEDDSGSRACDEAATPLPTVLDALLTDYLVTDVDKDGRPEPGDALLYTVIVTNKSAQPLTDLLVSTALDPHLEFLSGTVTTTAGSITSGQQDGDTSATVSLGTLAPQEVLTITFKAAILELPPGLQELSSQGTVSGSNFETEPTDDPDTAADDDPTVTPLAGGRPPVADIPTLSEWGAILLMLALATVALSKLRNGVYRF